MAAEITERPDSRIATAGDQNTVELRYNVTGADDEAEALAALLADAPATQNGLAMRTYRVEPVGDGSSDWLGTVTYGGSTPPKVSGTNTFSFDTTGGTQHITQAKEHIQTYFLDGDTPPDYEGAIGVTDDSVEGCDIVVPKFSFTIKRVMAKAEVTPTYILGIFALTGKTNNAECSLNTDIGVLTFNEDELLFGGATGGSGGDNLAEITFHFSASPNVEGLLKVGSIEGISKKGWEYLWVQYKDAKDDAAKCVIKKPKRAVVDRVYDDGDFSALGLSPDTGLVGL